MPTQLRTLLDSPQFGSGLTAGLLMAIVVLASVALWSRRPAPGRRSVPEAVTGGIGAAFVIATVAGFSGVGPFPRAAHVPTDVLVGLALLWCGGAMSARGLRGRVVGSLLALVGGGLLAAGSEGLPAWTVALLVAGPALAGSATADLDERLGASGTGCLLLAVALGGMYVAVPDTELARVALGAALPLTLLAWPFTIATLGRGGSYAAIGLFLWIAAIDGAGRPGSTVGAAACLGVLVAEPLGRLLAGRRIGAGASLRPAGPPALLVGAQLVLACYFARVAGFQSLAARAALLAAPVAAVAVFAAAALAGSDARQRPQPDADDWL